MESMNETSDTIFELKSVRDQLSERIEVLDKVKKLFVIPEMEVMTTPQVAEYFEVPIKTIQQIYSRNSDEIKSDGAIKKYQSDFLSLHNVTSKNGKAGVKIFKFSDNAVDGSTQIEIRIPNCGILCFSRRAVLRIAMLLRDSAIAREFRNQLLNIFETVTVEQRIEAIENEQEMLSEIGRAFASGSIERLAAATQAYYEYTGTENNDEEKENL